MTEMVPLKYPRPKILAIDLGATACKAISAAGFNVAEGSFGSGWRATGDDDWVPADPVNASLPNHSEQEVILIDLTQPPFISNVRSLGGFPQGQGGIWTNPRNGLVDPRPLMMDGVLADFNRILEHGGVFVIFATRRVTNTYKGAYVKSGMLRDAVPPFQLDNWGFLSILKPDWVEIRSDIGQEMFPPSAITSLEVLLAGHLDKGQFSCTIHSRSPKSVVLANNKYGQPVAVALKMDRGEGLVIILPDIHDKPGFLLALLQQVLPELLPELFPHAQGGRWVHRPDYELPGVGQLQDQITALQQETEKKIVALREQIEGLQEKGRYTYDLLRETGAALVAAVRQALSVLGFQHITDVDEQIKQEGQGKQLREDLQIHDGSPILIIDVKGVQGLPSDSEALQAQKHAHIRIVEWKRTDVRSLTIINHQRHVPALQRENRMPFRQEILDAAQPNLGLITTWDLFRLVRSYLRNGWRPDDVLPLFYQNGRIYPIPGHYQCLGIVEHTWKEAVSVQVQQGEFAVGDRIAFELPVDFEEQNVTSLQLDDREVQKAKADDIIGLFTGPRPFSVKKGMRVFRVGQG